LSVYGGKLPTIIINKTAKVNKLDR
jgi:hypothetical protein